MRHFMLIPLLLVLIMPALAQDNCPNQIVGNQKGTIIIASLFSTMVEEQTKELSALSGYGNKQQRIASNVSATLLDTYGVVLTPDECATNSIIHNAYRQAEAVGINSEMSKVFLKKINQPRANKIKIAKDFLGKK